MGAEPPFGDLYGMPTFVDERLLQHDTVVFRNGSHSETMVLATDDYRRLAEPRPVRVGVVESG